MAVILIDDVIVHDEKDQGMVRSFILSHLTDDPKLPTPIGVFRQVFKPTYDEAMVEQIDQVTKKKGKGRFRKITLCN